MVKQFPLSNPLGRARWVALALALGASGCEAVGQIGGSTPEGAPDAGAGPGPTDPAACTEPVPGRRLLRRLARAEYDHTVRDLLGVASDHGARFASDTVVEGFDNHADALTVSGLLADQLRLAAEELAARADLTGLVPCALPPADATACAQSFVETFGARAFRRPMTSADVSRYLAIHRLAAADEGFEGGVRWVITAMLQSPHFLYRPELGAWSGAAYTLDAWERASLLSYSITGTMPDAALFELARSDVLMDPVVLEREARRLFRTPAGRANVQRFVGQWLSTERLAEVPKDAVTYPELTPEIRAKMKGETERFVEHVVFEGTGTVAELMTANYGFVDEVLARFYGISPPTEGLDAEGFGRVTRTELGYSGILTHGSMLTTHARASSTSPVHRGKVVRERLLCQPLPPPPPGIVVQPPPLDPSLTTRERYAAHGSVAACAGCHRVMDPIGFAFEHWDGIGRFRADENGRVIDARGEITASRATDGTFDGTAELGRLLAGSAEVSSCLAEEWARFAWGVSPKQELPCATDAVARVLREPSATIEDLAVAIATSVHARERTGAPPAETPEEPETPETPEMPEPPPVEPPPVGEPEAPETSADLMVDVHRDASWDTGFCDQVTVTNLGTSEVEWVAVIPIDGTLTQHWNSEPEGDTGDVAFRGAEWNRTLAPAGSTSFGYCAAR